MPVKKLSNREKKALKKKEKFVKICQQLERKYVVEDQGDCRVDQCNTTKFDDTYVDISGISIRAGRVGPKLLTEAELRLRKGHRYGLVGRNGLGKTTLLKSLADGTLHLPCGTDLFLCEQELTICDTIPTIDFLIQSDTKLTQLQAEADRIESCEEDINLEELDEIYAELNALRADASEARARKILSGLGFTSAMQNEMVQKLSWGWKTRLSLARALFVEPSLLLLDEPTNHLDIDAVLWLEHYLKRWKKTLILVSHDQILLNQVCTDIIHLDNKKLNPYKGNYRSFKLIYEQRRSAYLRKIRRSQSAWWKPKYDLASTFSESEGLFVEFSILTTISLNHDMFQGLGNPILLGLKNVSFSYQPDKEILKKINFTVKFDTRVVLVGPNGVGKTTFLKLLGGKLSPSSGERYRDVDIKIGVLPQQLDLPLDLSPLEYLLDKLRYKNSDEVHRVLSELALEPHAWKIFIKKLSGGQKTKVALARLVLERPDVIILDEPTNNLDFESIDALIAALNNFQGGIVMTSHDQRTVEKTRCELWQLVNCSLSKVPGGFSAYKERFLTSDSST